jgi:hypothetical protein
MNQVEERPIAKIVIILAFGLFAIAWVFWRLPHADKGGVTGKVIQLQVSSAAPPTGGNFLPEQRRKFAVEYAKKAAAQGVKATVTTTGDFHKTFLIRRDSVAPALVREMAGNDGLLRELRGMGFRHLQLTNGATTWDIDLKN